MMTIHTGQEMDMALSFAQITKDMRENAKTINDMTIVNTISRIKVF